MVIEIEIYGALHMIDSRVTFSNQTPGVLLRF